MTNEEIKTKMLMLSAPIDEAIMLCDTRNELLMLASMMQIKLKDIYDTQLGVEGRREMFITASQSQ